MRRIALAIVLGIALAGTATVALGSRNTSGTYSLPVGNPVITGTPITKDWANNTLGDLATEMSSSLDRNGRGGMLAPLRTQDGTVTAPAHSFTSETGTGFYRIGASDLGLAVSGTKVMEFNTTGAILGVTRPALPTVGQQVSSSCGNFSVPNGAPQPVTNLSVAITTTGRPVIVSLQPEASSSTSFVTSPGTGLYAAITVTRDGTAIATPIVEQIGATSISVPFSLVLLDAPAAGAHTYAVTAAANGTGSSINRLVLVAREL